MGALVGHVSKTDVDGGELTNRRERWWIGEDGGGIGELTWMVANRRTDVNGGG